MTITSWHNIADMADKAGARFPELVAAQWALESAWGQRVSGRNNYFGIKGKGTKHKTREWETDRFITITDEFQDYDTPQACVNDLVNKWYKDYKGYQGINRALTRDEAARLLVVEGYATDPDYAKKLINLMNRNSVPNDKGQPMASRPIRLLDAAKYYKGEVHQVKAWEALENALTDAQLEAFSRAYRTPIKPPREPQEAGRKFPLKCEYFYQRDSKTGHGERSCQSSAIAMAVEYINPSLIYDDDEYLRIVFRYGDTVSSLAQKAALDSLKIKNQFRMNGNEKELLSILDRGYPVPIGILHKGNVNAPSGGGHWITLIGYDDKNYMVHDPFGELDLVNGGYPKTGPLDGKNILYTRKNLMKRWLIASNSDGWFWDLSKNEIK